MNDTKHILTCLAEECGELAEEFLALEASRCFLRLSKCAHKSMRFGLDDKVTYDPNGPRGTEGPTNLENILEEANDILGVLGLLADLGTIPKDWNDPERQERKKKKILAYMQYARNIGELG